MLYTTGLSLGSNGRCVSHLYELDCMILSKIFIAKEVCSRARAVENFVFFFFFSIYFHFCLFVPFLSGNHLESGIEIFRGEDSSLLFL